MKPALFWLGIAMIAYDCLGHAACLLARLTGATGAVYWNAYSAYIWPTLASSIAYDAFWSGFFGVALLLLIKGRMLAVALIVCLFSLLGDLHSAHATTYTVSPTGADSNPGTEAQPFATIQRGADVALPGDTVLVVPGTYTQTVTAQRSGTAAAPILYLSPSRGGAQLRSAAPTLWAIHGDHIIVDGFDLGGVGGMAAPGVGGQGGFNVYSSHVQLRRNTVHDLRGHACGDDAEGSGTAAILAGTYAHPAVDISIVGNVVRDNGGGAAMACPGSGHDPHGIYHVHSGCIAGNVVENNRGAGIHAWHAPHDLVIRNNFVRGNGASGILVGGSEESAHHILVLGNVVRENYGHGIYEIGANTRTNQFRTNVLWHNAGGDIALSTNTEEGTRIADMPAPLPTTCDGTDVGNAGLDGPGLTDTERTALLTTTTAQAQAVIAAQRQTLPHSLTPVMPTFPSLPGRPGT